MNNSEKHLNNPDAARLHLNCGKDLTDLLNIFKLDQEFFLINQN